MPQCEETGADFKVGGPMWLGPLHDPDVVQTALDRLNSPSDKTMPDMKWIATQERLEGLLLSVKEELNDVPLYYGLPDFCKTLRCTSPPLNTVKAALINAGYRVSGYHKDPQAIKTDAPNRFLWDIFLQVVSDDKKEGITILDALAASGLRSMRYWKEIPGVKHVTINDLEPAAVHRAKTNIAENGLEDAVVGDDDQPDEEQRPYGIRVQNADAKIEMYQSLRPQYGQLVANLKPQWDVIDLDPYGSAAPFLDAAVQAIESLCVTCTDMAALGGSHPETCYGRYASMPIPSARYLQEAALRILLCSLATTAAKYGRTIQPILSVGMNFYIRVFVEVKDDKAGVSAAIRFYFLWLDVHLLPIFAMVA